MLKSNCLLDVCHPGPRRAGVAVFIIFESYFKMPHNLIPQEDSRDLMAMKSVTRARGIGRE